MTTAKVSQAVVEVIRQNTAVQARASQAVAVVLRKEVTPPNIQVDQVVIEVLRQEQIILDANSQVSQVVMEILRAESTLAASFTQGITIDAALSLDIGTQLAMTGDIAVNMEARLELGSELAQVEIPVGIVVTAPLQATAILSATLPVSVDMTAPLEEGVELYLSSSNFITTALRAALTVHPENQDASRFFLLF